MRSSSVLGPVLLVAALTLGGCGGADSSASGRHNAADVTFAQEMVPHHTQALEMVALTEGHHLDPDVAELVQGIDTSQSGEVATMSGWLRGWGEKVPTTMSRPMNGMLSADELSRLRGTRDDAAFQRLWLVSMVRHHEGAIPMARTEIENGTDPEAIELAQEIVRTQQHELRTMGAMIGQ